MRKWLLILLVLFSSANGLNKVSINPSVAIADYDFSKPFKSSLELIKNGYVYSDDEFVYSTRFKKIGFPLYKRNIESGEYFFVSDDIGRDIVTSNNKVYYTTLSEIKEDAVGGSDKKLFAYDEETHNSVQLTNHQGNIFQFVVFENFICYGKRARKNILDSSSYFIEIRIVDLEDGNDFCLFSAPQLSVANFFFHDEMLYLDGSINDEVGFFRINPKTKEYINLFKDTPYVYGMNFFVFEDELYFLLEEDTIENSNFKNHLYKSTLDGNNVEKVDIFGGTALQEVTMDEHFIYYVEEGPPRNIYKIRRDGTDNKLIFSEYWGENLILVGDSLFFTQRGGLTTMFEINVNAENEFIYH